MEQNEMNEKILTLISAVVGTSDIDLQQRFKDIAADSLTLMKVIVAIEQELDIFLDDIDFITVFNSSIDEFIKSIYSMHAIK